MEIERKNQKMELFSPPIQHSRTKVPTLFAVHHLSHLIVRLLRKIPLQTTKQPFFPPLLNIHSQPNISGISKNSKLVFFWKATVSARTEIQTETIPFENNFNLQTTNKNSIKLPPITISNFNGNPLKYYEWINNFFNLVHNNTSLTDAHRITYLQNSVVGKAKEKIQA